MRRFKQIAKGTKGKEVEIPTAGGRYGKEKRSKTSEVMRSVSFLLISLLFLSACKQQETAVKESSPETTQNNSEVSAPAETVGAPVEPWSEFGSKEKYEEFQQNVQKQKLMTEMGVSHRTWADSVIIGLERTGCFGSCPSFKFSISENGYAYYKGFAFVDLEGEYQTRVDQSFIQAILQKSKDYGYQSFKEFYWEPITDVPTSYSIIEDNTMRHHVLNQSEAPQDLIDLEAFIESEMKDLNWKKMQK